MITVDAPATVGNFGPGFDALSLALHGVGDRITLETLGPDGKDQVIVEGPGASGLPTTWHTNIVGPVLDALRARTGRTDALRIRLHKPRGAGSGLGSSASSAAGAALAFHGLHPDAGLGPRDLLEAAVAGERALGGGNADDVAAVITGGLAVVRRTEDGHRVSRIQPPEDLHVAVLAPHAGLATRAMRALLRPELPRDDVVWNLGRVAALVAACYESDVPRIGACLDDRVHLPERKVRVPHFDVVRDAALAAGAYGACLSGSGPAMVAVHDDEDVASEVAQAMRDAADGAGVAADAFIACPEMEVMHHAVAMR